MFEKCEEQPGIKNCDNMTNEKKIGFGCFETFYQSVT